MAAEVRGKVLVVDDDPHQRRLMETLLKAGGCGVCSVDSGPAALGAVGVETPDLILLDVMMPGMDGFEVLHRLKASPAASHIPVIMVTALDDDASRARLNAAGAERVIIKPVDRWQLKGCLDEFLGERRN